MRSRGRRLQTVLLALALLLFAAGASAVPIVVGGGAFDGSETTIDFESLAADEEVTTQFANLTVSGGLFGDPVAGPNFLGSGFTASNFENGTLPTFDVIDIVFAVPMDRFRFDAITNGSDDIDIVVTSALGGTTTFSFSTSLTPTSLAIQDVDGIASIQIVVTGPNNHAFAMDNFQYAMATPEPGTALLLGLGLLALGRRRTRSA